MITQAARDSLERIFFQAARTRLTVESSHACDIVRAAARDDAEPEPSAEVLVLTIASIAFRIVLLLQFADDEATRAYYLGQGAERTLREAGMEIGNLCCGAINQQLVDYFPDLGMSTPYALSSDCMGYIDALEPGYVAAYDVTIEHAVRLRTTLCVCMSAPLDFVASVAEDAHESAGELELF